MSSITFEIDFEDDIHEVIFTLFVGEIEMEFSLPRPHTSDENEKWIRTWNSLLNTTNGFSTWEIQDSAFSMIRWKDTVQIKNNLQRHSSISIEKIPFDSLKSLFETFASFHLCNEELGKDCDHLSHQN